MQIEALKEAYEAKEMWRKISFLMIHVDGQRPICIVIFVPLTKRGSIGERRDRRQKKMRRTREI